MNNDLANEIAMYRAEKLMRCTDWDVTDAVFTALDQVAPGSRHGLQGIDAGTDGITRKLWEQAVIGAENSGALTFPQYVHGGAIPADAECVSKEAALQVVAGRVARAILIVNGMAPGFGRRDDFAEDWTMC